MAYSSAVTNYSDALTAVTRQQIDPNKITDQIFDALPIFALMRKRMEEKRGGMWDQRTINIGKSPNASMYTGSGGWKMSTYQGLIAMGWDWKFGHDGVVATGPEITLNESSDEAIVDLVQGRVDVSALTLPDLLASEIVINNPYGTNSDGSTGDPNGPEGLAVLVDNGTISGTVGQQSRTSYTTLKAQANYAVASGSSALMSALQSLWTSVGRGSLSRPKINFTTAAIYNTFWGALQTPERYVIDPRRLDALGLKTTGGNDLAFNDAPVLIDEKVPTGVTSGPVYTSAGFSGGFWYMLNTDYFNYVVHPDRNFNFGEWYKDPYGDQYFLDIFWAGMLECVRPNKQAVLYQNGG